MHEQLIFIGIVGNMCALVAAPVVLTTVVIWYHYWSWSTGHQLQFVKGELEDKWVLSENGQWLPMRIPREIYAQNGRRVRSRTDYKRYFYHIVLV